jgi:hypothetical protein
VSPVKFSVEQAVRSEPENIRRPFKEMQNSVDCYQMYEIITHAVREGFNRLYLSIGQILSGPVLKVTFCVDDILPLFSKITSYSLVGAALAGTFLVALSNSSSVKAVV